MRAVVQRVLEASVTVEGKTVSEMGPGLLVLLGVGKGDGAEEAAWMADKIANLRIFEDEQGKMNRSLLEGSRTAVVVSQFTLYGDARKGRRPSFIEACEPEEANRLYEECCARLRELGLRVGTGVFRAQMKVALVNDGPVTILLETPTRSPRAPSPGSSRST
jgi:D-tyrosyl-tRNA(Tyr) deacylase